VDVFSLIVLRCLSLKQALLCVGLAIAPIGEGVRVHYTPLHTQSFF
jgi:hypothetical protein